MNQVVLDKYVKPSLPVVDYKTDITGVTAEDVEKATLTVADIQKKLRRFLSVGTILVGHGLNNDLQGKQVEQNISIYMLIEILLIPFVLILMTVLKIDHARVIDTALVFNYAGARTSKLPSLNNVCKVKHVKKSFYYSSESDPEYEYILNDCFFVLFVKAVLGHEVRMMGATHNCVHDAAAAMKVVLAVVEKGVDTTIPQPEEVSLIFFAYYFIINVVF